jgi:hypothetical protein
MLDDEKAIHAIKLIGHESCDERNLFIFENL